MVIARQCNGLGCRFPEIAALVIILCETLLHQYT